MSEYQGESYNIVPPTTRYDTNARVLYGWYSYEYAMTVNKGKAWYYMDYDKKEPIIVTHAFENDREPWHKLQDLMYVGRIKHLIGPCLEPPNIKGIYVRPDVNKGLQKPYYPILSILDDELFRID